VATITQSYLHAAGSAADLIRDPTVAAAWGEPSALRGLTVGGLANHLARQVDMLPALLAAEVPAEPPIPLLAHYERVKWLTPARRHRAAARAEPGGTRAGQHRRSVISPKTVASPYRSRRRDV
jgi:hypothetical protein